MIAAACELVGEERLKIISLLLQLLRINSTARWHLLTRSLLPAFLLHVPFLILCFLLLIITTINTTFCLTRNYKTHSPPHLPPFSLPPPFPPPYSFISFSSFSSSSFSSFSSSSSSSSSSQIIGRCFSWGRCGGETGPHSTETTVAPLHHHHQGERWDHITRAVSDPCITRQHILTNQEQKMCFICIVQSWSFVHVQIGVPILFEFFPSVSLSLSRLPSLPLSSSSSSSSCYCCREWKEDTIP